MNTNSLTYNDGKSGYSQSYDENDYTYTLNLSSAKRFSIDVTLSSNVTADANSSWFTVTSGGGNYAVTINDAFLNAVTLGSATIKLTGEENNTCSLDLGDNVGNVGDKLTLVAKDEVNNSGTYNLELSAYKTLEGNTFTYNAAQSFTISGLQSGLFSDNKISGVTLALEDNKIKVTLTAEALNDQDVIVSGLPGDYSVEFILASGVPEAGSHDASAEWSSGGLKFTAAGATAGYQISGNMVRYYDSSGGGGENFTISGLKDLNGYEFTVDADGKITATKSGETNINVGTVTKDETNDNGTVKTTFKVKLNNDALPSTLTDISITSEANVYFTLSDGNLMMSKNVAATLTAKSESTPPQATNTSAHTPRQDSAKLPTLPTNSPTHIDPQTVLTPHSRLKA